jgi:hypothetical protein
VIVYRLACADEHYFEGWFASSEACEQQAFAGQIRCPVCDSHAIRKLPSAPYVKTGGEPAPPAAPLDEARLRAMVQAEALALLRKHIVDSTEDVRRIHYREEDARNIRGRATREDAEELREEGIETFTLPGGLVADDEMH